MDDLEISTSETIYNKIGDGYNFSRKADPFICGRLLDLLSPDTHETYLDIGCGTGNYTVRFAEEGYNFYGIDPSHKMLGQAMPMSTRIKWLIGSSSHIPISDHFFAGAIASLTVHHWKDIDSSYHELSRILKKNSRLVVFTSVPEQIEGYWLNYYFPKMIQATAQRRPSLSTLETVAQNAGFKLVKAEKYFVQGNIQDRILYSGKHDPEIYFNARIRKGMSPFAALANEEEISTGLKRLRADLDNWEFEKIKQQFESNAGDYLFVVFEKL